MLQLAEHEGIMGETYSHSFPVTNLYITESLHNFVVEC